MCAVFETPFRVAVTCVRVPVLRAHCESINLEVSPPPPPPPPPQPPWYPRNVPLSHCS
eukprot:COSAG03_NODE_2127_length_3095_cov_255.712617_6_plen_57_part_01